MDETPAAGGRGEEGAPAPETPGAGGPDLSFLFATGIALVAAFVLVRNLLPAKEDLSLTLHREQDLQLEIDRLRVERDLLERQEEALQMDDRYKERVLRGQTGMTRPGEWIVR